jgi:small subunit ribosomal protein S1
MKKQQVMQSAQAATEENPMEALLAEDRSVSRVRSGEVLDGTIERLSPGEIIVNIGYKADAVVDSRELTQLDPTFLASLSEGDRVRAYVIQEDRDGNVVISLQRAQQQQDWQQAEDLLKSQDVFDGVVTGYNRGGLIVKVGKVRGFVPASQLSGRWQAQQDNDGDPEERWAKLVGQKMRLKVVELDRQRNRLILSERAAAKDFRQGQKDRLLSELKKGDVLTGIVTSLAAFGAFVDLGSADGLIHLSEIAWHRVEHPAEVLHVGQEVQVYILGVDEEKKRIALSLRRLTPEPWSVIDQTYSLGQIVIARITKLTNFGAFAKVDDSIEGLIHISELADYRIGHPKEVVQEGDEVHVRVIRIDPERRRIGLSLRQAAEEAYVEVDWQEEAETLLSEGDQVAEPEPAGTL